jgi:hypothetical protein
MTNPRDDPYDEVDPRNDIWSVRDGIIAGAMVVLDNMDPYMRKHEPSYGGFAHEPFDRLNAYDRSLVLQRVRGYRLDGQYAPYCIFWLPDEQMFAVATRYPREATELLFGDVVIDRVLAYVQGEITGANGSFRNGGVLTLRDVVDDHSPDRLAELFEQLDGQTHEVGDGSNARFTLKSHPHHGQVEVRLSGRLAPVLT